MQENLYEKILRCLNNDEALYMRKLTLNLQFKFVGQF